MSEENSLRFWVIPIVCGIGMMIFLSVVGINYVVHTVPLAEKQHQEILEMSCDEIEHFPSNAVLYTPTNRKLLSESTDGCAEATKAAKAKQNEILQEKLKDPNSVESLLKEFRQQSLLQSTFQDQYDFHHEESQKLFKDLTAANNKISDIQSHPNWPKVLERLNEEN
ncbi:hypothetical protein [Nitrosopumilus sp.]|uniref:hypothetical protein n=1 Tax=Nitrosopumilus sp. TaxID=2024843 RepID=UPI00247B33A1|nr:hypothetical protein [Nitrosopumilus sp.]MCV0431848.1 hypothetical protein [Nitrosopumilus sp.]